jgi:hypothetical protein
MNKATQMRFSGPALKIEITLTVPRRIAFSFCRQRPRLLWGIPDASLTMPAKFPVHLGQYAKLFVPAADINRDANTNLNTMAEAPI